MLQIALVPPYGEVNKAVKPIPKSDGDEQGDIPQRSYRGHKRAWEEKNMGIV